MSIYIVYDLDKLLKDFNHTNDRHCDQIFSDFVQRNKAELNAPDVWKEIKMRVYAHFREEKGNNAKIFMMYLHTRYHNISLTKNLYIDEDVSKM